MTSGEANCFKLLDDYTRVIHGCFLTEFDPKGKGEGSYLCCLRHLGTEIDGPNRYACKYVTMGCRSSRKHLVESMPSGIRSGDTRRRAARGC
jgi:hypothetical protein